MKQILLHTLLLLAATGAFAQNESPCNCQDLIDQLSEALGQPYSFEGDLKAFGKYKISRDSTAILMLPEIDLDKGQSKALFRSIRQCRCIEQLPELEALYANYADYFKEFWMPHQNSDQFTKERLFPLEFEQTFFALRVHALYGDHQAAKYRFIKNAYIQFRRDHEHQLWESEQFRKICPASISPEHSFLIENASELAPWIIQDLDTFQWNQKELSGQAPDFYFYFRSLTEAVEQLEEPDVDRSLIKLYERFPSYEEDFWLNKTIFKRGRQASVLYLFTQMLTTPDDKKSSYIRSFVSFLTAHNDVHLVGNYLIHRLDSYRSEPIAFKRGLDFIQFVPGDAVLEYISKLEKDETPIPLRDMILNLSRVSKEAAFIEKCQAFLR